MWIEKERTLTLCPDSELDLSSVRAIWNRGELSDSINKND